MNKQQDEVKLFKLNKFDWVAATDLETAVQWYMKEHGLSREDAVDPHYVPYEESLSKPVWVDIEELTSEELKMPQIMRTSGDVREVKVSARRIIKKEYKGTPFVVCSTEP